MNNVEKVIGFVIITGLFWAGFGSLLWGLAAGICVIGILFTRDSLSKAHFGQRR